MKLKHCLGCKGGKEIMGMGSISMITCPTCNGSGHAEYIEDSEIDAMLNMHVVPTKIISAPLETIIEEPAIKGKSKDDRGSEAEKGKKAKKRNPAKNKTS